MKKAYFILVGFVFLHSYQVSAQLFKGVVYYKIHYDVKKGGTHPSILDEGQGNYKDYYTNGCISRTVYRYNDRVIRTDIYDCNTQSFYSIYPNTYQVIWHSQREVPKMEIQEIKREKDVLEILRVSCDRLTINFSVDGREGRSEYFLYPAFQTNDVELITIQRAATEDSISKGLPLATVSEGYSFTKIEEATEIIKNDTLSTDLFQIPDDNLIPNGLTLEEAPKPKRGYEWWYSKLYSSLRYPTSARRDHREERVVVMLTITDDGKLENPTVINEVDTDFKLYVERLLNRMLVRWEPGIQNGKPITSAVILPLNFVIVP